MTTPAFHLVPLVALQNPQPRCQSSRHTPVKRASAKYGLLALAAASLLPIWAPALPAHARARPAAPSSKDEVEIMSRMGVAIACGALIGVERRTASANAGIRTMSLVSLGSAIFALTSMHGLGGDPSRMGAAISTGIGFLGSGAITDAAGRRQLVTAASIWIAAAVGVAAACGLYRLAVSGAIMTGMADANRTHTRSAAPDGWEQPRSYGVVLMRM
ncbi:membrane protein MgtC [Gracilaria domingensis]|nr:membrane protein MgtC [Gracilaria domingensis]